MAKRMNGRYEPGLRSDNWLKIKAERTCDCVIAGYTHGQGGRSPAFGALILGLYENRDPGCDSRPMIAGQSPETGSSGDRKGGLCISAMSVQGSRTRTFTISWARSHP